ncbi:putative sodium-dependent galactose transporter [Aeromonas phage Riv-10]|nr:putative sodium-dependent galactose transporter [Aeromonas phage Riv-10]
MQLLDMVIFAGYIGCIVMAGLVIGWKKSGTTKSYFMADRSLPWWILGCAILAANISAEHLIGTTGSAYAMGIAIGAFELTGALALVVAAWLAIPYFVKNQITTMPQFLAMKYDNRVRSMFATFWIVVYTLVNLTAVSYMGALAFTSIGIPLEVGVWALIGFAVLYSAVGGLSSLVWTDFIQVGILLTAGIACTWFTLDAYGVHVGSTSIAGSMVSLYKELPNHFQLVLEPGHPAYENIPGILGVVGVFLGSLSYFAFNQFIVQGALAAKSVKEAQKGMVFAAFLKLLMPLVVIIPGIMAYSMTNGSLTPSDKAYPWLIDNFMPVGFHGLVMAALFAAIISTLAAILNSISTMFTLDIVKVHKPELSDKTLMKVARTVVVVCGAIGASLAIPFLGNLDQAYHFIQEFVGFVTPAMLVIFFAALYWKTNSNAAIAVTVFSVAANAIVKFTVPELAWLDRFLMVLVGCGVLYSLFSGKQVEDTHIAPSKTLVIGGSIVAVIFFATYITFA